MAADVKPIPDVQAIYGLIRNTETSEIRILLYKQPPNCAHTITYVSTYSRHKNTLKFDRPFDCVDLELLLFKHDSSHVIKRGVRMKS